MRIYLIRHGESEANLDKNVNALLPDHCVPLSSRGREQAREAGVALREMLLQSPAVQEAREAGRDLPRIRMWRSPYLRTRETADGVLEGAGGLVSAGGLIMDVREKSQLREQEFGLFDGIPDDQLPVIFPREYALYRKAEENGGRFWAMMPMGESRCNVAERVHEVFGTFHRDAEHHGIHDIVIVSHGVTIRAFVYAWANYSWEWFEHQKNPGNASIWVLEDGKDHGIVFPGWNPSPDHAAQEVREAGVISRSSRS